MRKTLAVMGMTAALMGPGAQAQTYMWPAPASPTAMPTIRYFLPTGTPLMLRTRTQVNTKMNEPGDRVYLEVAQPVSFRGQTVIPAGAPVIGEVAQVQRNGHFGVKGKIMVRLIQVETPSGPVRLTGSSYDEGRSGTALSVGTIVFISVLGVLVHGTSGDIPADTSVTAYLAEPMNFRWQQATQDLNVAMVPVAPDGPAQASATLGPVQALAGPAG